jgi:formamidopyrimidine-DNA glycosylase
MPELPDITVYVEAMRPRIAGQELRKTIIRSPFLLRTFEPTPEAAEGRRVRAVERMGKRIVIRFDGELHYVLHLMIAGRLLWKKPGTRPTGKTDLAAFQFDGGTLVLTEASPKKRASLHVLAGREAVRDLDAEGLEPLECKHEQFVEALTRENRTLKRALTSPHLFSGIGNAYSDEILFEARLSPMKLTRSLDAGELERLHLAMRNVLMQWIGTLRREFGLDTGEGRFPKTGEITAFRPEFHVHGKYGQNCFHCGHTIARIRRADSEINYCPTCQNEGRMLADRSLSRLLKEDWPETVEEWEGMRAEQS